MQCYLSLADTSFTKKLINLTQSLHRSVKRNESNLFLVEGKKNCKELQKSSYNIIYIVINKDIVDPEINNLCEQFSKDKIKIYEVSGCIFQKLSHAVTPQGILAVVEQKKSFFSPFTSFIVLDEISDPGNVGTIIRTADWFGIKQVILLGECAGKYSPKVVRSTMGSFFRVEIIEISKDEFYQLYSDKLMNIRLLGAFLDADKVITDLKLNQNEVFGLVVGNESRGISGTLEKKITEKFKIPGNGEAESLNVGVALGISLFHLYNNKYNNKKFTKYQI